MTGTVNANRLGLGFLIAACVALAVLNLRIATETIDISPVAMQDGSPTASAPLMMEALSQSAPKRLAEVYSETLRRPIFRPSRRPPKEINVQPVERDQAPAPPVSAKLPEGVRLVGIVVEGAKTARALIRADGAPTGEWVEIGHELAGWRVSRIEPRSVTFEAGGRSIVLSVFPNKTD